MNCAGCDTRGWQAPLTAAELAFLCPFVPVVRISGLPFACSSVTLLLCGALDVAGMTGGYSPARLNAWLPVDRSPKKQLLHVFGVPYRSPVWAGRWEIGQGLVACHP